MSHPLFPRSDKPVLGGATRALAEGGNRAMRRAARAQRHQQARDRST